MSPLLHIFKELIRLCQRFGCWMRSRPTILLYSPASLYFPQVCFYRLGEFLTKLNPFLSVSSFAKHRYMHGMIMKQTRKRHKKWWKWHSSHDTPIRKDPQTPKNCCQVLLKTFLRIKMQFAVVDVRKLRLINCYLLKFLLCIVLCFHFADKRTHGSTKPTKNYIV